MIEDDILIKIQEGIKQKTKLGRKDNDIHISDLPTFCTRRYCLCHSTQKPFHHEKYVDFATMITWEIGRKFQTIVEEALMKSVTLGGVLTEYPIIYHIPKTPFKITGSVDILVKTFAGKEVMCEVKSMRVEDFESDTISPNYQIQMSGYLWLVKAAKISQIDDSRMMLIKFSKVHKPQPIKVIPYLTETRGKAMDKMMKGIIKSLQTYSKDGVIPKEGICKDFASPLAKQCPQRNLCFKGEEFSEAKW